MNGLVLPTGSSHSIKGDTNNVLSDQQPPTSPSFQSYFDHTQPPTSRTSTSSTSMAVASTSRRAAPSHSNPARFSSSPPSSKSPASLAFIPRTSRTSAGIRKPLKRCTEFELSDMLDRNERILASPLPSQASDASSSPAFTIASQARLQAQLKARERLRKETQDIRRELEAKRGIREIGEGLTRWKMEGTDTMDGSARQDLEEAIGRLTVQPNDSTHPLSTSPLQAGSASWGRDTLAVKRRLAEEAPVHIPGSKVLQLSYEQSIALQSSALLAERDRERRAEELRASASKERAANGLPSGTAHRLGRKSISSANSSVRKASGSSASSSGKAFGPCPGFGMPRKVSTNSESAAMSDQDLVTLDDDVASDAESDASQRRVKEEKEEEMGFEDHSD